MRIEELPGHNELKEYGGQILRTPVTKLAIIPEDNTESKTLPELALHIQDMGVRVFYTMNYGEVEQKEVNSADETGFVCKNTPVLIIETIDSSTAEDIAFAVKVEKESLKAKLKPQPKTDVDLLMEVREEVVKRAETLRKMKINRTNETKLNAMNAKIEAYEDVVKIIEGKL